MTGDDRDYLQRNGWIEEPGTDYPWRDPKRKAFRFVLAAAVGVQLRRDADELDKAISALTRARAALRAAQKALEQALPILEFYRQPLPPNQSPNWLAEKQAAYNSAKAARSLVAAALEEKSDGR